MVWKYECKCLHVAVEGRPDVLVPSALTASSFGAITWDWGR